VEGKIVASVTVKVFEPFDVAFSYATEMTRTGLIIRFSSIKPTDKKDYLWYMDDKNPTNSVNRTDASTFTHLYPVADIKDREEITVRLLVRDTPCVIDHSETIAIPALNNEGIKTFDPIEVVDVFIPKTTTISTTNFRSGTSAVAMSSASTNPYTQGKALLAELGKTMKSAAKRKKLLSGSLNATLAKQYSGILSGIQDSVSQNRRSLTAAQKKTVMEFYGQLSESMITVIGLLSNDLKRSEALTKAFNSAGAGMKAMVSLGMGTAVKNGIKNRLTALSGLDKPVAAEIAKSINKSL